MSLLTPRERRGTWLLAALLLTGTLWDLAILRMTAPRPFDHRPNLTMDGHDASADTLKDAGIVDLNRSTVTELRRLPGVGPVLARRIVAYREAHGGFRGTQELLAVRGIGPTLYSRLAGRLRASPHR